MKKDKELQKIQAERERKRKIAGAMTEIDKAKNVLNNLIAKFDRMSVEALKNNNEADVPLLIKKKIYLKRFITRLERIKLNLEINAATATAIGSFAALPQALAGCANLIAEAPDMKTLDKQLGELFNSVTDGQDILSNIDEKMEDAMKASMDKTNGAELYDDNIAASAEFKEEMDRLKELVKSELAAESDPISKPADPVKADDTGDIDYQKLIDDINNKK